MNIQKRENGQYRVGSALLLLFTAPFIVWQIGVLYYSGTTMSLFGRTPVPLTQENTIAIIAAGYIVSILFLCLFPRKAVLAERILLPAAAISAALMLFPFTPSVVTVLFYIEAFICTFSIGVMLSVAAHQLTIETTWRDGIIGTVVGGILISVLQNDIYKVSFTVFTVFSILLILFNAAFYWLIPGRIETPYASRESRKKMPKILFHGLWIINAFSTLLLCFASSFAESVPHGVSVLYLSAALMAVVLYFVRKKLKANSLRVYGGFFALSVLGFVLANLSRSVPALRYPALFLLGFIVVLAALWAYFAAISFNIHPTKYIGAIGAGMGLMLAVFHSGLQELLRDDIALLYGIYVVLSVVLLIVYFFLEPYFIYAWKSRDALAEKAVSPNQSGNVKLPHPFDCLSEQESILAKLILDGHTEGSAAKTMNISLNTEKGYRKSLYSKLDIHSKKELFEIATEK